MKRLTTLQSDQLTVELSDEFCEEHKGLSRSNPQEYQRQLKIYVEKGRISKIYEFPIKGKKEAKDEKS